MKRIIKCDEPGFFSDWKKNFRATHNREPEYQDFRRTPEWEQLIQVLLDEQGYICCYCTQEINGWDSHIEHFIPRDFGKKNPHSERAHDIQLRYDNLFLSCNGEHGQWDHCGRLKDNENSPMLLSPINPNIEAYFKYDPLTGKILENGTETMQAEAMTTIRVLNLDSYELKRHRSSAIHISGFFDEDFDEMKEALIAQYSSRDENNAFPPYCAAIVWVMQNC